MTCDIDYRYRRALEPDGLTTFENALRALNEAVDDARLAALDPALCPAIKLLTRHLGRISNGESLCHTALDDNLCRQCIERIAELKRARESNREIPLCCFLERARVTQRGGSRG